MDLLKNSSTYRKYLDRINEYKDIADKNDAFISIQNRVETLSVELKSKKEKTFYRNIHLGLLVLSIAVGVACLIKGALVIGVALLVSAVVSKYIYTHTLKSMISSTKKDLTHEREEKAFDMKLQHKMLYLKHGIELKGARISMVRNSFMIIFPLMMIASVTSFGLFESVSIFVQTIFAAMMGVIFWFFFFSNDLDELDYQEMELQEYMHDFLIEQPIVQDDSQHMVSDKEPEQVENLHVENEGQTVLEQGILDLDQHEERAMPDVAQLKLKV